MAAALLGAAAYINAASQPYTLPSPGIGTLNTTCYRYGNQTQCTTR